MTKSVALTSFFDAKNWPGTKYSSARWQPNGFSFPEARCFAPIDPDTGAKMVHLEPEVFAEKYVRVLRNRESEILAFLDGLPEGQTVLCCWCNKARQKGHEYLYCHTVLMGWFIEKRRPEIQVVYADGRHPTMFAGLEKDRWFSAM